MDKTPQPQLTTMWSPTSAINTLGVELEVWLVDNKTRQLAPVAAAVLEALGDQTYFKKELFCSIIEVTSDVCHSVTEVMSQLNERLARLRQVTQALNIGLMCTGSHPFADWRQIPVTNDQRYQHLVEQLGWPARRLLICGVHVHVGMHSSEHAVAVMNSLSCFVPHLLALSGSSPYWGGIDTGMASARCKVFDGLPTAGLPPALANWHAFVGLMHTLMNSKTIVSIREIWWDIRLHPDFGTVEVRICDGINNRQELQAIIALIHTLVAWLQDCYNQGYPLPQLAPWTLRENKWRAARYGLEAKIIRNERGEQIPLREHLQQILANIADHAAKLGAVQALQDLQQMLTAQPSYWRQRQAYHRHHRLEDVVDNLLNEHALLKRSIVNTCNFAYKQKIKTFLNLCRR